MPLSIILLVVTPAGAIPIRAVLVGIVLVGAVPVGAVLIRPVLLPLDGGGLSALGSGFNI
jgi:hypothetical protein